MNFFIRQNSTLPILKVQVVKDSRNNFREFDNGLSAATITFSMYEENTNTYKILDRPAFIELVPNSSPAEYYVYYQFRKTDTKKIGGYIGEFKISYPTSEIILPLKEKLYINITESFADSDTCCRPNRGQRPIIMPTQTAKPTSTPSGTPTSTPTTSVTSTPTPTQTNTLTPGLTLTPTNTPSSTPTSTPTTSVTSTPTPTQTNTLTPGLTLTPTNTITQTPTLTLTQSITLTPTPSQTEFVFLAQEDLSEIEQEDNSNIIVT